MPTAPSSADRSPPPAPADARAIVAALRTVRVERDALAALETALATEVLARAFERAAAMIAGSRGRVVVSGMGKSGLVGRKIASTLASTGTSALFIHPAEAGHGDLGMIGGEDIVVAISWSGETSELSDIISYSRRFGVTLIAITSRADSSLASKADVVLALPQVTEACPNRLAPTSSTMVQAAIGDALAVALIEVRGFSAEDFRVFHPKGQLAARLLRVGDLMGSGSDIPQVHRDASILAAMLEMSLKRFGITAVVNDDGHLVGAFTDGDLRRGLTVAPVDAPVRDYMTASPLVIVGDQLASEALALMNDRNIMQLFVQERGRLVGIVHMHDILRAGVI